jgi:hypothetical protein
MKVLEIKNMFREDGCLYYLRKFKGDAVMQSAITMFETPIVFSIEYSPLGTRIIKVDLLQPINYPIIPVKKALQDYILIKDTEGKLP